MASGLRKRGPYTLPELNRRLRKRAESGEGGSPIMLVKRADPVQTFKRAVDMHLARFKANVDAGGDIAKARRKYDRRVARARAAADAALTAPGLAERDEAARARDQGSPGMMTPTTGSDADYSPSGFRNLKTTGYDEGSEDEGSDGISDSLSPGRRQVYERIVERSWMQKRDGETPEMAFSRFITDDPEGRQLFKAYKSAPNTDDDDTEPDDDEDDDDDDDAMEQLNRRARKLAKRARIPEPAAFLKICEDPSNRSLMEAAKRSPMPMEKSANDAHAALLALAAEAYARGKFATPEIAYERLLVARSPEIRALVKRARGAP
jgi:hypothetical protein